MTGLFLFQSKVCFKISNIDVLAAKEVI